MDKIKSNMHRGNKHFVLGLSFVFFAFVASVVWGFTYAEDTIIPLIPTSPHGLVASLPVGSSPSVLLIWANTSTTETKYNILRKVGSSEYTRLEQITTAPRTSYTDYAVTIGESYSYKVEACISEIGCSPASSFSNQITISTSNTNTTTPSIPTNLKQATSIAASTIIIAWDNGNLPQDSIKIQRKLSSSTGWVDLYTLTGPSVSSYIDSNNTPIGLNYDYRVAACLVGVCSDYSIPLNQVSGAVSASTTGTTGNTTCTGLNLVLNDGKTSYSIGSNVNYTWTCLPGGTASNVSTRVYKPDGSVITYNTTSGAGTATNGFSTSNLEIGSYTIKSCFDPLCAAGTVMASQSFNIVTANNNIIPLAPTNFRISGAVLVNAISLLWNNNSSIQDAIKIQKKLSSALSWADLPSLSGVVSYYTDSAVTVGTSYDYRLQSCILGICSPYISLEKIYPATTSVTGSTNTTNPINPTNTFTAAGTITSTTPTTITDTVKPLAPTNLTARVDGNKVILNWVDNSNNEAGFKIYRGPVWTDIGNVGPNLRSFTDFGRVAGTYTYRLNAFNSSYMYSSVSNDVTATVTGTTTAPSVISQTNLPVTSPTTYPVAPTTAPKTITPPPPTTINPIVIKTGVDTYPTTIATTGTTAATTTTKLETTTQIKEPTPPETPKDIIANVTAALNIIPITLPEIKTDVNQTEQVKKQIKQEEIVKQEKAKEEIVKLIYKDTNKDGISDYDSKYVYNMDPVKPSPVSTFEGKSITAGEKILLGFDPGKKELEKVVVEEPTTEAKPEIVVASYQVSEVSFVDTTLVEETKVNKETTPTKDIESTKEIKPTKIIKLKGRALPNSFITIYIYSTPIMVTVKTDSNGEWQYTMDKELEDGKHTVYTATVNNTGNIVAKSTPFTFVKTAEAVTLQDIVPVQVAEAADVQEPGFFESKNIFIMLILGLMMIGVTLILIGLFSKKTTQ